MRFTLIDRVLERSPERVVATKLVTGAEEYLGDHFPTFPVLPGVMMLEALVEASRIAAAEAGVDWADRLVLGSAKAIKYGAFVRPGRLLRVEVTRASGELSFKGMGTVIDPEGLEEPATAVAGRITLRRLTRSAE
ncbi:MAG: beta-hydroxyacyl-ACP dehydratase [Planctomycetota bacterium]